KGVLDPRGGSGGLIVMDVLGRDIRYGFRMLVKSPGLSVIAVLSMALGIGANTTIFSLINGVLLRPIPVREPERLVSLFTTDERNTQNLFARMPTSRPNYEDYRDGNDVLSESAAYLGTALNLSGSGEPEQLGGEIVSGNYFRVLGVTPALG